MATMLSSRNPPRPPRRWTRWLDDSGALAMLAAVIAVMAFAACETVAGTHDPHPTSLPVAE